MRKGQETQVTIRNEKGEKVVCDVILTFENEEKKENYICYTDYSLDANGQTRMYVSIYNPDSEDMELTPIEDDEVMKAVADALNEIREEAEGNKEKDSDFWAEIEEEVKESDYSDVGMKAYAAKNYALAESAFEKALEFTDSLGNRNNLAYLIRRGEVKDASRYSEKDIVALLREGTKKKDIFSTINMALFWALNVGGEESWQLADQLIANLDNDRYVDAFAWWEKVAKDGDAEGYLVHLFLIRHGKIKVSSLGSRDLLYQMAKKKYSQMPSFMAEIYYPWKGRRDG